MIRREQGLEKVGWRGRKVRKEEERVDEVQDQTGRGSSSRDLPLFTSTSTAVSYGEPS